MLTVALAAIAAVVATTAYGGARSSGIIIDGTTGTVVNIDPANQYDYDSFTVDLNIFQGLYGFPHGAKLQPVLATGCSHSANLKTWTCQLRHGVKFSNGDPMTSADVKYSFDRVLKIKGDQGIYTLLSDLKSTTTSGKYTVVFHLKAPFSVWPYILSTNAGYVVDHKTFPADKILANTDTAHMIGTGPYVLTKFTPSQQAVFGLNKNYWGPKPKNSGLIINYFTKSSTMKLALEQGQLDMAFQTFAPNEIAAMQKEKSLTVHSGHGVVIRYLVFNVKRPPFNNLNVRKAIAYLMPRQTIASRVYHGTVEPLYSMVPKGLPGQTDAFKTVYGAQPNLAKAKAAMKAAHVKTPLAITLWWTPSHYGDASADEYAEIQRALDASHLFKVTLKSAEWAQYSGALGKQYGAFQLGWFPDYPDADDYTVSFYQTGSFYSNGYSSKKMDGLIAKERAAKTDASRYSYLKQMQLLGAQDLPTIPYWQGNMIAVSQKNVQGINNTLDAAYYMRFWLISK
ncbi:MAG TPA: ABC transporter substrate-binding protein [Gaiellaceae bacterium]|nr:ABC transporter substrate-binding protein [Gaiellaceae bacterium]